ncbi:MAG: hypothetical protein LUD03_04575 [Firmicutes bacterium]|nr:hypothetical protein [Bacillota bacterium]
MSNEELKAAIAEEKLREALDDEKIDYKRLFYTLLGAISDVIDDLQAVTAKVEDDMNEQCEK